MCGQYGPRAPCAPNRVKISPLSKVSVHNYRIIIRAPATGDIKDDKVPLGMHKTDRHLQLAPAAWHFRAVSPPELSDRRRRLAT
jgi:hypothetical protein